MSTFKLENGDEDVMQHYQECWVGCKITCGGENYGGKDLCVARR